MTIKKTTDKESGVVVKSAGNRCTVRTSEGRRITCRVKGAFRIQDIDSTNPVAVGDEVFFTLQGDGSGLINEIGKRENYIIRKATKLSRRTHIIAANIDQAILVVTLRQPETPLMFIDRFLVTAEAYHIPALIAINKIDLYADHEKPELSNFNKTYSEAGYTVYEVSALTGRNLEPLRRVLKGKTSLLSGLSGVGKSKLINTLDPALDIRVGEISAHHRAGKHTTTFAEMHELSFGGFVIDTPGIRSFGLSDLKEELAHRFPEMRKVMDGCKFSNCLHLNEPNCAVIAAVKDGSIAQSRYQNYTAMLLGDDEDPYRQNIHAV